LAGKERYDKRSRVHHTFAEVVEAPIYWTLWGLVRVFHDTYYYSWVYMIGKENIPPKGTPLIIVSNHINGLNDPLAIVFEFADRIVSIFARADIFNSKPFRRVFRGMYMLPAYRMNIDGEKSLTRNNDSFGEAVERLLGGNAVAIFPEAMNQTRRWLGEFTSGYLRIAFRAAEECDFSKDVVILPICNHYTGFFRMRERMMLKIGKPIHLQPYYEMYRNKPRTVQRELNHLVRSRVDDLMLDIRDLEHYDAIEYLRITQYGRNYCRRLGKNPRYLPDKLVTDKDLVSHLDRMNAAHPEEMDALYKGLVKLQDATRKLKIRDWLFDKPLSLTRLVFSGISLCLLFPLFVFSLIPHIFIYLAPIPITRKLRKKNDSSRMFIGGVQFLLSCLHTVPVSYTITFLLEGFLISWIFALIHLALLPSLGVFAWNYRKLFIKWKGAVWYRTMEQAHYRKLRKTRELRERIFRRLDELMREVG